jgi:hypothetical protein
VTAATGVTTWVTCTCGNRGYGSKAVAKKRARQHYEGDVKKQMRQYRCPSSGLWHNRPLPYAVICGELTRADVWPRRSTP